MLATATQAKPSPPVPPPAKDAQNGDAPGSSPGKTDAVDDGKRPDEGSVDKKKQPDTVPMAVFKGRLAEQKAKIEAAQTEANTLRLTVSKAEAALQILQDDNERLREQLRTGRAYNEAEDDLHLNNLDLKGQQLAAKLAAEHAEKVRQATEEAAREERRLEVRSQIVESVQAAITKYPLVSDTEVYDQMTRVHEKTGRLPSATEIARLISEHKQKQLTALGFTRAAASNVQNPQTVSGPTGGANLGRTGSDRQSMADFARQHLGHR